MRKRPMRVGVISIEKGYAYNLISSFTADNDLLSSSDENVVTIEGVKVEALEIEATKTYPQLDAIIVVHAKDTSERKLNKSITPLLEKYQLPIFNVSANNSSDEAKYKLLGVYKKYDNSEDEPQLFEAKRAKLKTAIDIFKTVKTVTLKYPIEKERYNDEKTTRQNLIDRLNAYIERVERHVNKKGPARGKTNFEHGFRLLGISLFAKSRGINREANYLLAIKLRDQLADPSRGSIDTIFSNVTEKRNKIITKKALNQKPGYVKRNINSDTLNYILFDAENFMIRNRIRNDREDTKIKHRFNK